MSDHHQPPLHLIDLGIVYDAQGLKGHIKVRPYSTEPVALLQCKEIYLHSLPSQKTPLMYRVYASKAHSGYVLMQLENINDRDGALALKGSILSLPRSSFPVPEKESFYWVDLIGCEVWNMEGVLLGQVEELSEYGAHPIMKVGIELIPFVSAIVKSVELPSALIEKGRIIVDWQANWSQ